MRDLRYLSGADIYTLRLSISRRLGGDSQTNKADHKDARELGVNLFDHLMKTGR